MIVSWTTINNYMICPSKVEYESEGIPHSIGWGLAGGNCGHHALPAWASGENWREAFEDRWEQYIRRTANDKDWNGEFTDNSDAVLQRIQILSALEKYTEDLKDRRPSPKNVEVPLTKDLGDNVVLTGRVDCLSWEGKLIDWKFTSNLKYLNPLQMLVYAVLTGGPCESEFHCLVKTRSPYWKAIPVPETKKQENLDRVVESIIKPIAKAIESGVFYANPNSNLCGERYCGYWSTCRGRLV